MKTTKRSIPVKRSYSTTAIILIAVAIALFLLKNSILDNKKDDGAGDSSRQTAGSGGPPQYPGQPDARPSADATPPTASTAEAPTAPTPEAEPAVAEEEFCQKTAAELIQFLARLEGEEYIKSYALNQPIQTYLNAIIIKILDNPPVNEKETADLMTVLKNASHFYRILGAKDLFLIKDILTRESGSLERQLASLYAWSMQGVECRRKTDLKFQFSLAKSYEYAAFFLNTLGGHSYLARRDSTVRVLTKYYSVLIIDQAARHSLNRYSINLPYHLAAVIQDISNNDFLENQTLYLDTLKKIKIDPQRQPVQ